MKVDKRIRDGLVRMFAEESERIRSLHPCGLWVDIWCDYLGSHKEILFGHTDDLIEFFNDEEKRFSDGVLIRDPALIVGFILVDWGFAEKVMALGFPVDIVRFAESRDKSKKRKRAV